MTQLEIENDAGTPVTTIDFGAIFGGNYDEKKLIVKNVGDTPATSVLIQASRIYQNDGIDNAFLAIDESGNPGEYTVYPITVGTLAAGATYTFWVKIVIPSGESPAGNPRQLNLIAKYQGS
jgi:hypothetical protein